MSRTFLHNGYYDTYELFNSVIRFALFWVQLALEGIGGGKFFFFFFQVPLRSWHILI